MLDDLKKVFRRNFLTAWTRLCLQLGRTNSDIAGACWNVWESV